MEKRQAKHLSDLIGKGVEIKEKTLSPKKQEEQFFLKLVDVLCAIGERSLMAEDLGISLFTYDLGYMEVIENLLNKKVIEKLSGSHKNNLEGLFITFNTFLENYLYHQTRKQTNLHTTDKNKQENYAPPFMPLEHIGISLGLHTGRGVPAPI